MSFFHPDEKLEESSLAGKGKMEGVGWGVNGFCILLIHLSGLTNREWTAGVEVGSRDNSILSCHLISTEKN